MKIEQNKSLGFNLNCRVLPKVSNKLSTQVSTQQSRITQGKGSYLIGMVRSSLGETQSQLLLNRSMESVTELTQNLPQIYQKNHQIQKTKSLPNEDIDECTIEEAERVWRNSNKKVEERSKACKFIAESYLNRAFGNQLPKIDPGPSFKFQSIKNKLNTNILSQILNEIQYNSRSHSILIRKSELQELQNEFGRVKETQKESKFKRINLNSQEQRLELMHRLKNQYDSLKDIIITAKNQEYDEILAYINNQNTSCDLRQTMKSSRGGEALKKTIFFPTLEAEKQNKVTKDLLSTQTIEQEFCIKTIKMNSNPTQKKKIQSSNNRLTIQNCGDINPKIFLYMTSRIHFQHIKVITLKQLWFFSDLLFFLLDCVRGLGSHLNYMESFECSSVKIEQMNKFSDKISAIFAFVPIKVIKLQSLDLTNRQISKIAESLSSNPILQTLSFRHNKIDILGLRYIQELTRSNKKIRWIDLRNNQIPHYANLKDKIKIIQFF